MDLWFRTLSCLKLKRIALRGGLSAAGHKIIKNDIILIMRKLSAMHIFPATDQSSVMKSR